MDRKNNRRLKPALGLIDAAAISVGAIIGAGIYVVIGIAAGLAGPPLVSINDPCSSSGPLYRLKLCRAFRLAS
jgi:hypothetical protein